MTRIYGERIYPEGVDPKKVDKEHNSHGEKSPYTDGQRKQVAALVRTLEGRGYTHEQAMDMAFDAIGLPEKLEQLIKEHPEVQEHFKDEKQTRQ